MDGYASAYDESLPSGTGWLTDDEMLSRDAHDVAVTAITDEEWDAAMARDVQPVDGLYVPEGSRKGAKGKEEDFAAEYTDVEPEGEEDDAPELTFEEQCDKVRACVSNRASHREILYKTLVFCETRRSFHETEAKIATFPEFEYAGQTQYRLIMYLVDAGGLRKIELDEDGGEVTPEMKQGLTEDEADDLVYSYALETTRAGRAVADEMNPQVRIRDLFSFMPERKGTFEKLLAFCKETRTYSEIAEALETPALKQLASMNPVDHQPLKASAFVDKLERAGGIVWKDGWQLTAEGRKYLETLELAAK